MFGLSVFSQCMCHFNLSTGCKGLASAIVSQPHAPPGMTLGASIRLHAEPTSFLPLLAFAFADAESFNFPGLARKLPV